MDTPQTVTVTGQAHLELHGSNILTVGTAAYVCSQRASVWLFVDNLNSCEVDVLKRQEWNEQPVKNDTDRQ